MVLMIKINTKQKGFSLIELLVVIAIIMILITAMAKVGGYVRTNAQIKTTKNTITLLCSALQQYKEYYPDEPDPFPTEPYAEAAGGGYPYDFVNFEDCFPSTATLNNTTSHNIAGKAWEDFDSLQEIDQNELIAARASIKVLYWHMDDVSPSQAILNSLPESAKINEFGDYVDYSGEQKTLIEVIDAWHRPIRYRTNGPGNFPTLTSAGPDGVFDSADDIVSSEF